VGVIVGHLCGFDPRTVGSGNIGMTNVARAGGRGAAALTFAGDFLKGLIPILAAQAIPRTAGPALAAVGLAAFVGSIASIFLGFHGGRGVSTSLGVWIGLAPAPVGISILVFILVLAGVRIVSLASLCAAIALPLAVVALGYPLPYILLAVVMSVLVMLRHKENIGRLLRGEEPKIGTAKKTPPA